MNRSPLLAAAQPAATVALADWTVAAHFGDPQAEAAAVLGGVGLVDRSERGRLRVDGPDRLAWLNRLVTNDTARLRPGSACRAFLLTVKGKLAADLRLAAATDWLWLDTAFDTAPSVLAFLGARKLFGDQVGLTDLRDTTVQLGLHGPGAAALLGVGELPVYAATQLGERLVLRHDELGVPGYDVLAPLESGPALWAELAAGACPFGWQASEILRLEHGRPRWGSELTIDVMPGETGLEEALSHTKGCYLGQEFVARLRDRGHANRHLRALRIAGEQLPARGATLHDEAGADAGRLTSVTWSARRGAVAMGYVRTAHAEPGTRLVVEVEQGQAQVEVA